MVSAGRRPAVPNSRERKEDSMSEDAFSAESDMRHPLLALGVTTNVVTSESTL
jgi:hypothetical protein